MFQEISIWPPRSSAPWPSPVPSSTPSLLPSPALTDHAHCFLCGFSQLASLSLARRDSCLVFAHPASLQGAVILTSCLAISDYSSFPSYLNSYSTDNQENNIELNFLILRFVRVKLTFENLLRHIRLYLSWRLPEISQESTPGSPRFSPYTGSFPFFQKGRSQPHLHPVPTPEPLLPLVL